MNLNDLTRKAATDIIAMQKKDGQPNKDLEVDIDNYLRKIIETHTNEQVKSNSHYLLSKFTHTIAVATAKDFSLFDRMMKEIGYHIQRM